MWNTRQGQKFRNRPFRSLLRWKNYLPLAFPVDALKFPNVPITESELLIVIMIGGSKNLSVIFTIALSNAVAMLSLIHI